MANFSEGKISSHDTRYKLQATRYNVWVEFQSKQKFRRFCYSKVTIFFMIVFIGLLLPGVYNIYTKNMESVKDKEAALRQLDDLQDREKSLSTKVNYEGTDRGIEGEIRGKFNVAKTGESVIVLVDTPVVASTSESDANIFRSMWNKLKKVF